MTRTGLVRITSRGFRQDALSAIGSDPVRALIELITNSDDAYRGTHGRIDITIQKHNDDFPVSISVFDHARGMSEEDLYNKMTQLGGQNEAFQAGDEVRGNLGRGAKDCAAFGGILFESIRNDMFCSLLLKDDGNYSLESSRSTTMQDRKNLRLDSTQSGLCATMLFAKPYVSKINSFSKLLEKLGNEAQLRDINVKQNVVLTDTRGRQTQQQSVLPFSPDIAKNLLTFSGKIDKYEGSDFLFVLDELATKSETSLSSTSIQGILLTGSKAIFENSLFGLESQPETKFLRGRITFPLIDNLLKEFDLNGATELNDGRLIRRDRSGLDSSHSLMKELAKVVVPKLQEIIEDIRKNRGGDQSQGAELSKKFRLLGSVYQSDIDELLEEEAENSGNDDTNSSGPLTVIPGMIKVLKGNSFTISLRIEDSLVDKKITITKSGPVELIENPTEWREHKRLPALVSLVRFNAHDLGEALLTFKVGDHSVSVAVQVVNEIVDKIPDYTKFDFVQSIYRCHPEGARWVTLVSPSEHESAEVTISSSSGVEVIVLDLNPSSDGLGKSAKFRVAVGESKETILIKAISLAPSAEAECTIEVQVQSKNRGPEFDFKIENSDGNGHRSSIRPGSPNIVVAFGANFSNKSALGPYDEAEHCFSNEKSPEAMRMLAELYSFEIAKNLVIRKAQTYPDDFNDPERVMNNLGNFYDKLIKSAIKVLKND